jgi:hypothetical protein
VAKADVFVDNPDVPGLDWNQPEQYDPTGRDAGIWTANSRTGGPAVAPQLATDLAARATAGMPWSSRSYRRLSKPKLPAWRWVKRVGGAWVAMTGTPPTTANDGKGTGDWPDLTLPDSDPQNVASLAVYVANGDGWALEISYSSAQQGHAPRVWEDDSLQLAIATGPAVNAAGVISVGSSGSVVIVTRAKKGAKWGPGFSKWNDSTVWTGPGGAGSGAIRAALRHVRRESAPERQGKRHEGGWGDTLEVPIPPPPPGVGTPQIRTAPKPDVRMIRDDLSDVMSKVDLLFTTIAPHVGYSYFTVTDSSVVTSTTGLHTAEGTPGTTRTLTAVVRDAAGTTGPPTSVTIKFGTAGIPATVTWTPAVVRYTGGYGLEEWVQEKRTGATGESAVQSVGNFYNALSGYAPNRLLQDVPLLGIPGTPAWVSIPIANQQTWTGGTIRIKDPATPGRKDQVARLLISSPGMIAIRAGAASYNSVPSPPTQPDWVLLSPGQVWRPELMDPRAPLGERTFTVMIQPTRWGQALEWRSQLISVTDLTYWKLKPVTSGAPRWIVVSPPKVTVVVSGTPTLRSAITIV